MVNLIMTIPVTLKEALKEGGRVVVLAILPIILAGINPQTGAFSINFTVLYTTALIAVLRFVDSYLHESGTAEKGLTRF